MHKIKLILLLILPLSVIGQDLGIIDTKTTKNPAINGTHRISTDGQNLFFRNFFGVSKKIANTDSPTFTGNVKISSLGTGDYVKVGLNGLLYSDNTFASDALSATQSALDLKANITSPTFISDATTPRLKITGVGDIGKGSDLVMGGNSNDLTMHGTGKVILGTGGFQRLVVTNAGNVGVGTTAPVAKFEVSGLAGFRYNDGKQADGKYLRSNSTGVAAWDSVKASEVFGLNTTYLPINNPTSTGTLTAPTIANSLGANFATTSGNVGIGTASPSTKLSISGAVGINTVAQSLILNNSTGVYSTYQYNGTSVGDIGTGNQALSGGGINDFAFTSRTGNLAFGTGSVEKMRIFNNGRVGIGTTTDAGYLLDVNGTAIVRGTARFQSPSQAGYSELSSNSTGAIYQTNGHSYFYTNASAYDVYFQKYNSTGTNMIIKDSGNIGIGTSTPSEKLEISGAGVVSSRITSTNSTAQLITSGTVGQIYNTTGDLYLTNGSTTNSTLFVNNGAERMRIFANGNVGIGTPTDAGYKLNVIGGVSNFGDNILLSGGAGTNNKIGFNADAANYYIQGISSGMQYSPYSVGNFTFTSGAGNWSFTNGNVGIGTTTPQKKLEVADVIRSSSNFAGFEAIHNTGTSYRWTLNNDNNYLLQSSSDKFVANATTRFSLFDGGNIGIGTSTNLGYKLDVNGTARVAGDLSMTGTYPILNLFGSQSGSLNIRLQNYITGVSNTGFEIYDQTNTASRLAITGTGNVGIGTSTPTEKLEISGGNVKIANNQKLHFGDGANANGFSIGADATNAVLVSQNNNSSLRFNVGFSASSNNVTSFTRGAGTESMRIDGSGNVGIGTNAPATNLHVNRATTLAFPLLRLETTGTGGRPYIDFKAEGSDLGYVGWGGTSNNNMFIQNYLNADLQFGTNSATRMTIKGGGNVLIGTTTDLGYKLDVSGTAQATQFKLSALNTAPASATATGTTGEIRVDANYIYICTATNTWKRSAITSW